MEIDRVGPSRRPAGKAIGYQRWTELAFVHWRLDAGAVQRLLPAGLQLDVWDGDAWVGLVPFHMSGVRPWWSWPVPGVSEFHETNVRTYVLHRGVPGVWFFSLEAASRLAVCIARWKWNLNYFLADMELVRSGDRRHYRSRRRGPDPSNRGCDLVVEPREPWPSAGDASGSESSTAGTSAQPGTLEHFLIERYYLYCAARAGRLLRGQVHHRPYPLRRATLERIEQTLLAAAELYPSEPPCHVAFSPGVDVEVFPLVPVDE